MKEEHNIYKEIKIEMQCRVHCKITDTTVCCQNMKNLISRATNDREVGDNTKEMNSFGSYIHLYSMYSIYSFVGK